MSVSDPSVPHKLKLPSHVREFQCAQCGECCTNKWRIAVDAISYDKLYNKFAQLGQQQELYDNIAHHDNAPRIRFLPNGKCPYLSNNNLCTIQLDIGSEYMLDICKIYPRRIFCSPEGLEFSLSPTCKTAVETLQRGQIRFSEMDWPPDNPANASFSFLQPNQYTSYYPDTCLEGISHIPYRSLENRFIDILQDSSYSVSQRLVSLGQLIKVLILDDKSKINVDTSLFAYENMLTSSQGNHVDPDWQHHLKQLFFLSNNFLRRSTSPTWTHLLKRVLLALSFDHKQQLPSVATTTRSKFTPPNPDDHHRKIEQYRQQVSPFAEQIIENYLVNYVLGKQFYFEPLHLAYYRLAFDYAATIAFSIGYGILTEQPVNTQMTLQAIYDVENIFYSNWFYPRAANFQAGQSRLQIIDNGIVLANI